MPSQAIFVDTETKPVTLKRDVTENVLWFGYACYVRRIRDYKWSEPEWKRFETVAEFWDWAESKTRARSKLYLYAHNWGFDALVLKTFSSLSSHSWKMTACILEEPPTVFEYRKERSTIALVDTLNYFRVPLAVLGANVGVAKLKMPVRDAPREKWDEYCHRDVDVLRLSMLAYFALLREANLGNYQLTTPSQAFTAYRHRFMRKGIFIDCSESALPVARKSYYGGRTECFFVGKMKGDFHVLDVNSQYPYAMTEALLPAKLVGTYKRVGARSLTTLLERYCCIADVSVSTSEPVYPLRSFGRLVFPVGEFRTILPHAELSYASEQGAVTKVHSVVLYEGAYLFREYVEELYALRKRYESEGNKAFAYLCKLFLNSLYGKFGQSGRVFDTVGSAPPDEVSNIRTINAQSGETFTLRTFGGIVQRLRREAESANSHPAIAACITSYARFYLWSLITQAGRDNVYYVDTDSLVVNQAGYDALSSLIDGSKLGYLKEDLHFKSLDIRTLKDYQFDKRIKIKGVRKNAVHVERDLYVQDTFRGIKGMIRDGDEECQIVRRSEKHLSRHYTKGVITPSGRVEPLTYYIDSAGETYLDVTKIPIESRINWSKRYAPKLVLDRDIPDKNSRSVDPDRLWEETRERRKANTWRK